MNITVDDSDLAAIDYVPASGWAIGAGDAYNETYRYSYARSASATFRFTGIAAYLISPHLPSTPDNHLSITLDNCPPEIAHLTTPDSYTAPHIAWSATGLPNTAHTLVVTPAASGYIGIDAFIYTTPTPPSIFLDAAPPTLHPRDSTPSSTPSSSPKVSLTVGLAIGFGTVALLLVAFTSFFFGFYCGRRRPTISRPPRPRPRSRLQSPRPRDGSEYSYGGLTTTDIDATFPPLAHEPTSSSRYAQLPEPSSTAPAPYNPYNPEPSTSTALAPYNPPAPLSDSDASSTYAHATLASQRSSNSVYVEMPHQSMAPARRPTTTTNNNNSLRPPPPTSYTPSYNSPPPEVQLPALTPTAPAIRGSTPQHLPPPASSTRAGSSSVYVEFPRGGSTSAAPPPAPIPDPTNNGPNPPTYSPQKPPPRHWMRPAPKPSAQDTSSSSTAPPSYPVSTLPASPLPVQYPVTSPASPS